MDSLEEPAAPLYPQCVECGRRVYRDGVMCGPCQKAEHADRLRCTSEWDYR